MRLLECLFNRTSEVAIHLDTGHRTPGATVITQDDGLAANLQSHGWSFSRKDRIPSTQPGNNPAIPGAGEQQWALGSTYMITGHSAATQRLLRLTAGIRQCGGGRRRRDPG